MTLAKLVLWNPDTEWKNNNKKRDFIDFKLLPTDLRLLSMVVQTQVGGQIFSGWDQATSKIKASLHGLSGQKEQQDALDGYHK